MQTRILVGTNSLIGISQEPFIELTGPSIKSNRWNKYISMSSLGIDRYKTRDYNHDVVRKNLRSRLSNRSSDCIISNNSDSYFINIRFGTRHEIEDDVDWTLKYNDSNPLLLIRSGSDFLLEGVKASLDTICSTLARCLFRSLNSSELSKFAIKFLKTPDNIHYALENKVPYHFYENWEKVVTRMNIEEIGDDTFAIELYEGTWGQISTKNLNTFLNTYRHGMKRGNWKNLSPQQLFYRLMDRQPSEAELTLMIETMKQNDPEKIVEARAKQLVENLLNDYPDRIKKIEIPKENGTIEEYLIRGKLCDWKIVDRGYKTDIQAVSSFVYQEVTNKNRVELRHENGTPFTKEEVIELLSRPEVHWDEDEYPYTLDNEGRWAGPICIDNLMGGSSVGDQIVARAMAFMNDDMVASRVNTIGRYLTPEMKNGNVRSPEW